MTVLPNLLQGKYKEAEALRRRATEITEDTLGKEHPLLATRLDNLGGLLQAQVKSRLNGSILIDNLVSLTHMGLDRSSN